MATSTYVALQTQVLTSAVASVTFSSIPSGYTDLVLVVMGRDDRGGGSVADSFGMAFNTDTSTGSTNYSTTHLTGNGSSASSSRGSNQRHIDIYQIAAASAASGVFGVTISNIQNYSNTTTFKTVISKGGIANEVVDASVGLWRNTAAINAITLYPGFNGSGYNWVAGSTFTIYGIANADNFAKATGGMISEDSTYWYHTFAANGTFTPKQSLSCDVLVVAGGGGGSGGTSGISWGPGGGAGQVAYTSSTLSTSQVVTVGAGGAGTNVNAASGSSGTASSLGAVLSANFGTGGVPPYTGGNAGITFTGGGGSGASSGGGAGSSANGGSSSGGTGGAGGAGTSTYSSWATVTSTGVGGAYAGGGGGGGSSIGGAGGSGGGGRGTDASTNNNTSAVANTGSGGGGGGVGFSVIGNGGSGIVIVRYLKA